MQKIFLIKQCLTQGITETEAVIKKLSVHRGFAGTHDVKIATVLNGKNLVTGIYHSSEFRETRAGAVARAEEMRLQRIKTLKKQLARLEALEFK